MKLKQLIEQYMSGAHALPDDLDAYLDDFVPNELLKSETLQEAYGIANSELEAFYAKGYELYEREEFGEAVTCFRWTVLLNPFQKRFWMGLAGTQQMLGAYEKALHSYAVAAMLDSDDPYPHYHAYHCYACLGNEEDAQKALQLALKRAPDDLKQELEPLCSPR